MSREAFLVLPLLAVLIAENALVVASEVSTTTFIHRRIRYCLNAEFVTEIPATNEMACASICVTRGQRCRGFRLTKGFCQMFEFDKCSHMLNQVGCDQVEWAFVRAQDDLPLGQLCSDGFGNGYLGSTYKMIDVASWTDGLNKCSSEPGELTKYADGFDRAEVDHFHALMPLLNTNPLDYMRSFYVGGNRSGTFSTGEWSWYACAIAFLPEVWGFEQPNASTEDESEVGKFDKANVWFSHSYGLDDEKESSEYIRRALCECIDPFY